MTKLTWQNRNYCSSSLDKLSRNFYEKKDLVVEAPYAFKNVSKVFSYPPKQLSESSLVNVSFPYRL